MQGLLVIEQSSTLSNLLVRTLSAGGYGMTSVCHDFQDALDLLKDARKRNKPYDAVVLGVPPKVANPIKPILKFLQTGEEQRRIPFLLVIHDKHPILEKWAAGRVSTGLLPWQRFSQIPGMLGGMLPEPISEPEPRVAPESRQVSVLFVDDSRSARYAYRQLLEANGFPVQVASSVGEAEAMAAEGQFDLMILDYYLPDGTGAQLCEKIRALPNCADATLAIITGSYRESIIKRCLDAGAIECMFKNEAKELFVTRVTSIARSIESHKSAEAERQRLNGILGSVGDGVYGVDRGGNITFINPTGIRLLGYRDESDLVAAPAATALQYQGNEETEQDNALEHCYQSGESLSGHETVFRHQNGKPLPVECTVFPLSIESERKGSVVVFRDISERKTVEQLKWEVSHDPLTGLSNRRSFTQSLERALEQLRERGGYDALLQVDIDRFDDIIDSGGEAQGERVLAEVAGRLGTRLRDNDRLARLEADKFALLLCGIQLPNLFTIADAFQSVLRESTYDFYGVERAVAGAIGVVILSRMTPSAEYALERARVASENAKKKGRSETYIYVSEDDTRTARELESGWEERFRDAVRHDRFVFLAQPIIPASAMPGAELLEQNGKEPPAMQLAAGEAPELIFELLLRMVSQDGQWVSPTVFVPLAERVNMVQEVDLWVIRNALTRLEEFQDSPYNVCLTVNISNVTLQDPDSLNLIKDVIESRRINPNRLVFEVTETAEIARLHSARKFMTELKKLGCRFALDDFGTGFSSFSHLKHLPVDFIKIDGMFVQAMVNDDVDRTMVNSITSMAHALGLGTIAEHVDSAATLTAVKEAGVDYLQGNFFGEPALIDNLDIDGMFGQHP
ncbi:MAG: EAL domain-containing protein [Xanthomonadales bacterium]|nr:EAL domain-containing protein [Xanthomonadales bacterium]